VHFFKRFFRTIKFRIKAENGKSIFVGFQKFAFSEVPSFYSGSMPPLLIKFSCKDACENLDAISARYAISFLQPMWLLSKKSWWPPF